MAAQSSGPAKLIISNLDFGVNDQDIKVKLKKGSVIIFPPFWTHPHETEDLLNNTYRYTINTWSCQKIN